MGMFSTLLRAGAKKIDLVDVHDKQTQTDLPLSEKPVGAMTYEHCLVEKFYKDIYMGTAERNYYVDRNHELCICVHYNRRIPGEYKFEDGYQFFVTKKRMCLEIYWNLGNIPDESMIIEYYDSIDDAKESQCHTDFLDLKKKIEEGVELRKSHVFDPFDSGFASIVQKDYDVNGGGKNTIIEVPSTEKREMIQFYFNGKSGLCEKISVSSERLSELMQFFKDFDDLDSKRLHLRKYVSLDKALEDPDYKKAYDRAINARQVWTCGIGK